MAGHDLVIEVTGWEATLDVGEQATIELTADPGSLRVREGSGGAQKLGEDDMAEIEQDDRRGRAAGRPDRVPLDRGRGLRGRNASRSRAT